MSMKPIAPLPRMPRTPREWQAAVDAAQLMLILDSCEQYGLIVGQEVNVERCELIMALGRSKGITPSERLD